MKQDVFRLLRNISLESRLIHGREKSISAIPIPDLTIEAKRQRIVLEGDVPSPTNPPSGCLFHTRCPWAIEHCRLVAPEFRDVGNGHYVACHLVDASGNFNPALGE